MEKLANLASKQRFSRVAHTQESLPIANGNLAAPKKKWTNFMPLFVILVVVAEIAFLGQFDMAKNAALVDSWADVFYGSHPGGELPLNGDDFPVTMEGNDRNLVSETESCEIWPGERGLNWPLFCAKSRGEQGKGFTESREREELRVRIYCASVEDSSRLRHARHAKALRRGQKRRTLREEPTAGTEELHPRLKGLSHRRQTHHQHPPLASRNGRTTTKPRSDSPHLSQTSKPRLEQAIQPQPSNFFLPVELMNVKLGYYYLISNPMYSLLVPLLGISSAAPRRDSIVILDIEAGSATGVGCGSPCCCRREEDEAGSFGAWREREKSGRARRLAFFLPGPA